MADTKLHWTQTEEGKRKMAAAQKKGWANRKKKAQKDRSDKPKHGGARSLVKDEIAHLAKRGAELELAELEKRIVKLRIFLGREGE